MPKIVIKAQVADAINWEQNFKMNDSRSTDSSFGHPLKIKVTGENEVMAMFDTDNPEKLLESLNSQSARSKIGIESAQLEIGDVIDGDSRFQISMVLDEA